MGERTGSRERLSNLRAQLRPDLVRERVLASLDEMFASGTPPDPAPSGFCRGRLVTTDTWGPWDSTVRRIAELWMPWLGKSFDPDRGEGVNVLTRAARAPMRALWPSYTPEREFEDRIEAFPFRTRVAPGATDRHVDVLKIEYDLDANPSLIIRRILDELVEIDDDLYLGKILYRRGERFRRVGFFTLERDEARSASGEGTKRATGDPA